MAKTETIACILKFLQDGVLPTSFYQIVGLNLSELLQQVCWQRQVVRKLKTAYHPHTNFTERINKILKPMIASYLADQHKNWDK